MNAANHGFWRGLETPPGFAAVAAVWKARRVLPEGLPLLQMQTGLAGSYPCPWGCGCAHQVFPSAKGRWSGVCQCGTWRCPDLDLVEEDLQVWEVSWPRLARALCRAFDLACRLCDPGIPGLRQVGTWSVEGVPVFLVLHEEPAGFAQAVAELCVRFSRKLILFAPTAELLDVRTEEMLRRMDAAFFALSACAVLTPAGTLAPAKRPGELFAAFQPAGVEPGREAARAAFEIVRKFQMPRLRPPDLITIFRLYCIEQLSPVRIARQVGCSRSTVFLRLKLLQQKTGMDPDRLRAYSPFLAEVERSLSDPRARRIHYRSSAFGEEEEES